jgi:hypothetical protein
LNKLCSVFTIIALILGAYPVFQSSGQSTEQSKLSESSLVVLAGDDDEVKAQAITELAKSGDLRLEKFFELYRQGSVYNWPDDDGKVRIVVNEETVMDDDFNEFAPLLDPLSGEPYLVEGKQAKPDLLDLEDISPGRKLRSLVNSS